ncbi:hypothetical protein AB0L67_41970 [Streptomyces flaveolus]|uniref:hypothetical protein n=1 Tax=Streptomyces flaveolus TaxID=67297 RepID=UPI003447379E
MEGSSPAGMRSEDKIAALYQRQGETPALVSHGILPKASRQGAPAWENQARQRMHNLLQPRHGASASEQHVLQQAGIALVHRKDGKVGIDPTVTRETEQDAAGRATGIGRLYGLAPESTPLISHGILPKRSRKGAPDWENQARQRMHHLLQPKHGASVSEQSVLRQAGIALVHRENGKVGIDPTVTRETDQDAVERATGIGRLYGLAPESTPLIGHGILPTQRRQGAPDWEKQARKRMHHLLQPKEGASVSEQNVLQQAGIALVHRENGKVGIDPGVARESGVTGKRKASGGPALPSRPAVQRKTAQAADASGDIVLATAVSSWGPHTSGTGPAGPTTTTNQNQAYPLPAHPMTTGPAAGSYLPDLPTPPQPQPQPQPGPAFTTPQYPPGPAPHYLSGAHSYATHPGQNTPSAPQHRPAHPASAALTSYTLPPPSEHPQTSQPTPYRPAPRPLPPTTTQPGQNTTSKRTR